MGVAIVSVATPVSTPLANAKQWYGNANHTGATIERHHHLPIIPLIKYSQIKDAPMDEGGSSVPPPTNENHNANFENGYDNDFKSGSLIPPPK
nr:hypothetical protein [Tanacetum cinerariifolium]